MHKPTYAERVLCSQCVHGIRAHCIFLCGSRAYCHGTGIYMHASGKHANLAHARVIQHTALRCNDAASLAIYLMSLIVASKDASNELWQQLEEPGSLGKAFFSSTASNSKYPRKRPYMLHCCFCITARTQRRSMELNPTRHCSKTHACQSWLAASLR